MSKHHFLKIITNFTLSLSLLAAESLFYDVKKFKLTVKIEADPRIIKIEKFKLKKQRT